MAKLYFRYGAMSSAKTLNLLAVAHNYRSQGKKVFLIQAAKGSRKVGFIASRAGLEAQADFCPNEESSLGLGRGWDCVLVDEAQFLSPQMVEDLRKITLNPGIPVICYGLRTDFRGHLFPGSQRLLELADSIEEIKVTCKYCAKKATQNMRLANGKPVFEGPQVLLGMEETYVGVCWAHYAQAKISGSAP